MLLRFDALESIEAAGFVIDALLELFRPPPLKDWPYVTTDVLSFFLMDIG